jgi:phage tail-like protein
MSLIDGPSSPPKPEPPKPSALDLAKGALGTAAVRQAEKLIGIRFDPAPAYLFYVTISGLVVGLFTSCDGLKVTREVEEIKEGGLNDHTHTLPGRISAGRITLKRGVTVSRELWSWFEEGLYDVKVKRTSMSIVQGGPGMSALGAVGMAGPGVIKYWNLEGAYPVSYSISGLNVDSTTQVAFESVEIACKTIALSGIVGTPLSPSAVF